MFSLKKHTKGVTALELHSSGKMLFSFGKDKKLIIWDLINAKTAFTKGFDFCKNNHAIILI